MSTQVITANKLPSGHLTLHSLPGLEWIYVITGILLSFLVTWLYFSNAKWTSGGAVLIVAMWYTSVSFFRVAAVGEVGSINLVLCGLLILFWLNNDKFHISLNKYEAAFWKWSVIFVFMIFLASLFSPVPGQSFSYLLTILFLIILVACVIYFARTSTDWKIVAWMIVVFGAIVPIIFALIKFLDINSVFGLEMAILYRYHPTEMGGANLVARSLLITAPIGAALLFLKKSNHFLEKIQIWGIVLIEILIITIIFYARSFEGFFAWLVAIFVFSLFIFWKKITVVWQKIFSNLTNRIIFVVISLSLFGFLIFTSVRIASAINPYSFNGRFSHWMGAIDTIQNYPLLGGGLNNEYLYTQFSENADILFASQSIIDDPLYVLRYKAGMLTVHAHNTILEIGAFSGIIGIFGFLGLILAIIRIGFVIWKKGDHDQRILAAACLAGIAGELAWGTLDVIRETPPFFSFPIWAIVGLLLGMIRSMDFENSSPKKMIFFTIKPTFFRVFLVGAAIVTLIFSIGSHQYASGFTAYQEHRWQDAANHFNLATKLDPISAHYQWMLSKAELELGNLEGSQKSLEKAISLKKGYSPYLTQAAWLAWLQNDVTKADYYFEEAIYHDPREGWVTGLHANLGILRAYQGKEDEAIELFAKSFEYRPQYVNQSYWIKKQLSDGTIATVLDPVYTDKNLRENLNIQILSHLGKSDLLPRHFDQNLESVEDWIFVDQVFENLEKKYRVSNEQNDEDAHLILAAIGESARLLEQYDIANEAYLEYQKVRPNSAFGFRELGLIEFEQNNLDEAQNWLQNAINVSPKDILSLELLSQVQLKQGDVNGARNSLSVISPIAAENSFQLTSFDTDVLNLWLKVFIELDDVENAQQTLEWIAKIRGQPEDLLNLATFEAGKFTQEQKLDYCWRAYELLIKNWVRPYDSQLWTIASCFAESDKDENQLEKQFGKAGSDFIAEIMMGHVSRIRNQPEKAIDHYLNAMSLRVDESAPHYFLGETFQGLNMVDDAEREFLIASELNPYESLPLLALGRLFESLNREEDALNAYEEALKRTPGWVDAQRAIGNFYLKSGNYNELLPYFSNAQELIGNISEDTIFDFISEIPGAALSESKSLGFIKADSFNINDVQKSTIFMHPDSFAEYEILLPKVQPDEKIWLEFSAGLSPDVWNQVGDGVNFLVSNQAGDEIQILYDEYIDPKSNMDDREWKFIRLDLSQYQEQDIKLTFSTQSGPNSNNEFDWAGWGDPRIVLEKK
jgi:tetratricopeptide (TPR) repeat protein/O-antigen ligase